MISIDTNILLYGLNQDCDEHERARAFIEEHARRSDVGIAELVLVELYVLLRNPAVVRAPLAAKAAAAVCQSFRSHPRWALLDDAPVMDEVWKHAARPSAAPRHVFDARLACTLRHHGVTTLVTRNVADFKGFGFERVWDPLS